MMCAYEALQYLQDVEGTMSMNKEDVTLKIWQLQEAVHRLRINVRTVHDTKCRLFSTAWRQVGWPITYPFPSVSRHPKPCALCMQNGMYMKCRSPHTVPERQAAFLKKSGLLRRTMQILLG